MSADRCPLGWKAAALEDGRLDGADRVSFEAHASRCADCRAEKKALTALYARLDALPSVELSPLEHQRRRGALLARANERFVGRRALRGRWLIVALALMAVCSAVAVLAQARAGSRGGDATLMPPRYEVVEGIHAVWRPLAHGNVARVELADGEATFAVADVSAPQQFVLALPDGDVESTGARFTVDVALGRTRKVDVTRGTVVVRRRDEGEMTLHAGEGWSRTEPIAETKDPAAAGARPAGSPVAVPAAGAVVVAPQERGSQSAVASRPAPPASSRRAGEKFEEAIGSFVQGSYARADAELRAFMEEFPRDARCEDAAFLSAVARWRMGDPPGSRVRAESYLRSYPEGLRRAEAQKIVDSTP